LLVGYFCSDSVTGLYKFARTLTDKFYMLFDAMNQVYFPTFMQMLSQGASASYRKLATRILVGALAVTVIILAVEYAALPYFVTLVLKGKFAGVEPVIVVMTIPFFFVTGMYIWMWPLVLHHNLAGRFTVYSALAVLVQYGVGILGFRLFQSLGAFTMGYVAHYVLLIGLLGILVHRRLSDMVPFSGPRKAKGA
jgi:O-antigen/teichoic acid export membrane protein